MAGVLQQDEVPNDYVFPENPDHSSVWITVDNISIYVLRTFSGVNVSLYPHGKESMDDTSLGCVVTSRQDAQDAGGEY